MIDNTSALLKILFFSASVVNNQSMTPTKQKARQILVVGTFNSRFGSQKRNKRRDVSKENSHKKVSRSFINALPDFL